MRDIKFRGLNHDEWIYGDLQRDSEGTFYIVEHTKEGLTFAVDSETVGQYTGLKDKNDKEIYKGDIVKVMDATLAVVKYSNVRGAYYLDCGADIGDVGLLCQYEMLEVLGNQFENSELLKGDE